MRPLPDRLPALGNGFKPCHSVPMEVAGGFTCTVFKDREFMWLVGPKRVDVLSVVLDLRDPRSLDRVLLGAARRDAGNEADLDLYRLEVQAPDGSVIRNYRYSGWFDEGYDPGYGESYGAA